MPLVFLILSVLFLVGACWNVFGAQQDLEEALAGLVIAGVLLGMFVLSRRSARRSSELMAWLEAHAEEIARGGAMLDGQRITPDTELVRYQVALSVVIMSFRIPTRAYIPGRDSLASGAMVATGLSLLLGWWGIPWGPIYTVQAVWRNARGGERETVGAHLAQRQAEAPVMQAA